MMRLWCAKISSATWSVATHHARQARAGTAQVATSVLAMTLTLIAVFVPVTFTTGVTGIIFKSFGITVACAMALSLIEAFTLGADAPRPTGLSRKPIHKPTAPPN